MNTAQPTAAQAAAFIRAAYELKEKLSDQVEMSIEVGRMEYGMFIHQLNIDEWKCVGWAHAFYSLFTPENALTENRTLRRFANA